MTTMDSITITWTTSPTVTSTVVSWEVIHDSDSTPRAVRHTDSGSSELLIGINTYTIAVFGGNYHTSDIRAQ